MKNMKIPSVFILFWSIGDFRGRPGGPRMVPSGPRSAPRGVPKSDQKLDRKMIEIWNQKGPKGDPKMGQKSYFFSNSRGRKLGLAPPGRCPALFGK